MLDQLVVGAAPGDAITLTALRLQEALSARGPSEIFANFREGEMVARVRHVADLADRPNADRPLVFHASIGCREVHDALVANEDRILLVYHNFSPAGAFERYAPDVADDLRRGWWELDDLRERVVLAVADSEFNAAELVEHGYSEVHVIPPLPDVGRIVRSRGSFGERVGAWRTRRRVRSWRADPLILTVAQQLPHKRLERVLASVAVLQQEFLADAHLAVVGVERFWPYSRALEAFAETVGLRNVHFLGRVGDPDLAALFDAAEVFLTLSDHEGFCVPVIEAMAAGVPVVASDRAALPGTVGDAGLLVDDPDDPLLVAAVLDEVVRDRGLRRTLSNRGIRRAADFDADASLAKYLRLFEDRRELLLGGDHAA